MRIKGELKLNGATYTFGRIPVKPLKNMLIEIVGLFGKSLGGSISVNSKDLMDSDIDSGKMIANFLEGLTPQQFERVESFFFDNITVSFVNHEGKKKDGVLSENNIYDDIFEDNLGDLITVLVKALKVYYGNFSIGGVKLNDLGSKFGAIQATSPRVTK